MKLYINNLPKIEHYAPVTCSSFSKIVEYMNTRPCILISAFRGGNSKQVNRERNKQLAQDIHNSDLTYIKCRGHWVENEGTPEETDVQEESFLVVNNGYTNNDFVKLGVSWCKKYGQECVLITIPCTKSKLNNSIMKVIGRLYNSSGAVVGRFDRTKFSLNNIGDCFTSALGKNFALDNSIEVNATSAVPYETMNGFIIASSIFKHKYPSLV